MSGGAWDYKQWVMDEIASDMRTRALCDAIDRDARWRLLKASEVVAEAALRTQRADWYISGDDGMEQYADREDEELRELREECTGYREAFTATLRAQEES